MKVLPIKASRVVAAAKQAIRAAIGRCGRVRRTRGRIPIYKMNLLNAWGTMYGQDTSHEHRDVLAKKFNMEPGRIAQYFRVKR